MEEGGEEKKKKKVMVAIDESEFSRYALEWALEKLADTISTSELVIFNAQPIVDVSYVFAATYGFAPPDLIRSIQENQQKVTLALLEKAKEICAKHGMDNVLGKWAAHILKDTVMLVKMYDSLAFLQIVAETMTEIGDPKEVICEAVEKLNIQLLVLGSHGRGAIQRRKYLISQAYHVRDTADVVYLGYKILSLHLEGQITICTVGY